MAETLAGTQPLEMAFETQADLATQMVAGIDRFLTRRVDEVVARRAERWADASWSRDARRAELARILGAVDPREPGPLRIDGAVGEAEPGLVAEADSYRVRAVRWPVFRGIEGEGLLLEPHGAAIADIVAVPDAAHSPEQAIGLAPGVAPEAQFARRLAESGCRVLVPVLIDRDCRWSGTPELRFTNIPHREFIYRAAFEMGRHLIGYEVQKLLAAADALGAVGGGALGVWGHGEGGLLALAAGALDERFAAVGVSGYFGPREQVWREPIYRNVWSLLVHFGDAELADLVAPRALVVEACRPVEVDGPPPPRQRTEHPPDGGQAAPGVIAEPALAEVEAEVDRARGLARHRGIAPSITLVRHAGGEPGSGAALAAMGEALGFTAPPGREAPRAAGPERDSEARMKRQFEQLVEDTQHLMREGEFTRRAFWSDADDSSVEAWQASTTRYRDYLWEEVIGKLPPATLAANARTKLYCDEPDVVGYTVVLDVYPDVFAQGVLLIPKDIQPGERRPVVIAQHGLEGTPDKPCDPHEGPKTYSRFGFRLAQRGFVVFAPQNPYYGAHAFRVLQRKANPQKLSLFSFIVRQHERILDWLGEQPFVDPTRIGFYGISYGGKTAMRVPALLDKYALSICSGDFNEWIWKNVSARHRYSYLWTWEYEMPEFDLGNTFNYAEMSWLIFPRPFMVERGHFDLCAPDEWVGYEYARTHRRYHLSGLAERTELEVFAGGHEIHSTGTFEFLHKHLDWPAGDGMGDDA